MSTRRRARRPSPVAVALVLLAAACGPGEAQDGSTDAERVARQLGVRAAEGWRTDFSRIAVPPEEIASGGPPKDGIPAIDRPRFVPPDEADEWLDPREPVMVVEHEGEAKAYPLQILIWHEIVNDEVGGKPLAITYCPLCNTALVFEREVHGRTLDFGTTGRLRHSDLIMYDRQTHTWWQQATGEAIVGELVGTELVLHPANTFAWERAKKLHPDLQVLSRDTGHSRRYGINPYEGYDSREGPIGAFFGGARDDRLPAMERVVAVDVGDGWAAPFSALAEARVVQASVDGTPLVVFWEPGAASALDAARIPRGRDIGQTAVYAPRVDGRTLRFAWRDGAFVDEETGSRWNLAGRAVGGPLEGARLEPVPHGNHFWFAWAVFRPDTEVWGR